MQQMLLYDVLRAMDVCEWSVGGTDTAAAVTVLKELVRSCRDFDPLGPWLDAADACMRLLRNTATPHGTRLSSIQFIKNLAYKSNAFAARCVEQSLCTEMCVLVHTCTEHPALISNICCVIACIARYCTRKPAAAPMLLQTPALALTTCDVLRMLGAMQRLAVDCHAAMFNCMRAIRRVFISQPELLECAYLMIKTQQMVVACSCTYMSKRHVQSEALKLVRVLYEHSPQSPGFALDCGMLEQVSRIACFHYTDHGISALACDATIACSEKSGPDAVSVIVYACVPASIAKARFKCAAHSATANAGIDTNADTDAGLGSMKLRTDAAMRLRADAALYRLLHRLLPQHDALATLDPRAQYRALVHLLSCLNCSPEEINATYSLLLRPALSCA